MEVFCKECEYYGCGNYGHGDKEDGICYTSPLEIKTPVSKHNKFFMVSERNWNNDCPLFKQKIKKPNLKKKEILKNNNEIIKNIVEKYILDKNFEVNKIYLKQYLIIEIGHDYKKLPDELIFDGNKLFEIGLTEYDLSPDDINKLNEIMDNLEVI